MSFNIKLKFISENQYQLKMQSGAKTIFSELSVLPGFNTETIEEALEQLQFALDHFPSTIDFTTLDLQKDFFNLLSLPQKALPSVLFALEGLFIQLLPKLENTISYDCNDLIFLDQAQDFLSDIKLSKVVKIKIGQRPKNLEVKLINELLASHPEVEKIRLDANKNLELEDLSVYAFAQLEYFENPLKSYSAYKSCSYPIALDEDLELLTTHPCPTCVVAMIFKPKVRLGISGMIKMIKKFPQLKPILTHAYEGEAGRFVLKHLPLWIPELNCGYQGLKFKD